MTGAPPPTSRLQSHVAAEPSHARPTFTLDDLASLELEQSQPEIYDRPVGLRLLYRDPSSGAEHYLVRYPDGLRGQAHRHSAAHTAPTPTTPLAP